MCVKPGCDVRPVGVDIALGQLVVVEGSKLGSSEVGLLSAVGVSSLRLIHLPKVAVLSTGNEVCVHACVHVCMCVCVRVCVCV